MRLQKFLASCGIASRRKCEEIIKEGKVNINGTIITEMGHKVDLENDTVMVDGKPVNMVKKKVYIMLNKPTGYITTVNDQFQRYKVTDLVDIHERIFPVGRLDYDTSGLLILTNDGDLTYKLTHPSHEIVKTYIAKIKGVPDKDKMQAFKNGLRVENYITAPANIEVLKANSVNAIVKIQIHEGKNRQVRKMCDVIGHPVIELKRVSIGELMLGDLKEGRWRHLTEKEINFLKKM